MKTQKKHPLAVRFKEVVVCASAHTHTHARAS